MASFGCVSSEIKAPADQDPVLYDILWIHFLFNENVSSGIKVPVD